MNKDINKIEKLANKNNWSDVEKNHAIDNIDTEYGEEYIIELKNGKQIHTSVYPEDCSYVRVTQEGYELAYWISDEWKDDPEIVMGAFLGALKTTKVKPKIEMNKWKIEINGGITQDYETKTSEYNKAALSAVKKLKFDKTKIKFNNLDVDIIKIWCEGLIPEYGPYYYGYDGKQIYVATKHENDWNFYL